MPFIDRRVRVFLPVPAPLQQYFVARLGRRRGLTVSWIIVVFVFWVVYAFTRRFGSYHRSWPPPFDRDPPSLVFGRADLAAVWEWEVASGHYQSSRPIPLQVGLTEPPQNPGLPNDKTLKLPTLPDKFRSPSLRIGGVESTIGTGPARSYLDLEAQPPHVAYPPRPVAGSIADLDIVMDHCDFGRSKYVRDCLEMLRYGAGLDNGKRTRVDYIDAWKYIFRELDHKTPTPSRLFASKAQMEIDNQQGLILKDPHHLEGPLHLPATIPYRTTTPSDACDPNYPRIFHMFWAGPFTDKPYVALLSFLFTQNLGLHLPRGSSNENVCRPKFWMWINPGPAASKPNPNALKDMFDTLAANPWSSPFLHSRFKEVIEFKLWNTTEQLDGIPEIKDKWRSVASLFNSGGHKYKVKHNSKEEDQRTEGADEQQDGKDEDGGPDPSPTSVNQQDAQDMYNMVGSSSASDYDRLSVILSDMARFVLCHRFGGTYLDADTILLRDWEELWGWKGAFAYRWSRLERYNTAVLRLNKGSALGSFLFYTALRNDLDFHPMTVSRYMKDAYLEPLLLRLPDALFDSAWLNTEDYQRDRPPFPYFTEFGDLFTTPQSSGAAPLSLGFEGFFRGAYSYHFHNFWWKPFDSSRNWPDLGSKFAKGEQKAKAQLNITGPPPSERLLARDLSWATVLKRTFEGYIRGVRPNMYGEWLSW